MDLTVSKVLPSPHDSRDLLASVGTDAPLPGHVDLLPDVTEVENQSSTSSCTANAAASALEISYKRAGHLVDFSRLFIYWFSRKLMGVTTDSGAYPRDMCKALQQNGVCLESTWDFDLQKVNIEPSAAAIEEAKTYPVLEYARLTDTNIVDQIKKTVTQGIPVLTSIKLSQGFYTLGKSWKEHDWNPALNAIGYHEVVIIGYDDVAQRFLAQNSWGPLWGDGGFFGIPYNRIGLDFSLPNISGYEYWILSKLPIPYVPVTDYKETDPKQILKDITVLPDNSADEKANKTVKILMGIMIILFILIAANII